MSLVSRLIYARRGPWRWIVKELLALYGVEVPPPVKVGPGLTIHHRGFGTVIHPDTTIGSNVTIYHGVTIGRADPWTPRSVSEMEEIVIEDHVVLCAGAVVLCKRGKLTIGRGSVIGANAVLTRSTGEGEIWAGSPAKRVGTRDT